MDLIQTSCRYEWVGCDLSNAYRFQMVSELKDHFLRHLQGVEKKKIEQMVLDYISKLVGLAFYSPHISLHPTPHIVRKMWFSEPIYVFFKLDFWRSPVLKPALGAID